MKRFIRKKMRKLSKFKIKPKKLAIISIFALSIFTFSMIHAFADNDVTFTLEAYTDPEDTTSTCNGTCVYDRIEFDPDLGEDPAYVYLNVYFDTAKTWDKVAITFLYDTDVFDPNGMLVDISKSVVKKYPSGTLSNTQKGWMNFQETGDPGRYTNVIMLTAQNSSPTLTGGLYLGTIQLPIRADAPGGETTISYAVEIDGEDMTYLLNGSTKYTNTLVDETVMINVPVTSHGINKSSISLDVNTNPTDTIEVNYQPIETSTPKNITFTSSNDLIATVDANGLVTAVAPGNCNITVTEFGDTHIVPVTVTAELIGITLSDSLVEIPKQGTHAFSVTTTPNPTTDTVTYNWAIGDTDVASVDTNGVVTGLAGGNTTLTVTAVVNSTPSTITAQATINVVVPFTSASARNSSITLKRGVSGEDSEQIIVDYLPLDATQTKAVSWSSNHDEIATVNEQGIVTAVSAGDAVITGQVAGISPFYVNVHVDVPILTFGVTPPTASIYVGQTQALSKSITPSDTNETQTVSWTSSNDNIATVDTNGVVTAVSAGTVTITAKTGANERLSATSTITIYEPISSATMSESSFILYTNNGNENKTKTLTVNVLPAGSGSPSDNEITWGSSDNSIATVVNGLVTAVGNGTATITARLGSGAEATATVEVKTKVISFTVSNATSVTLEVGQTHTINTTITPSNASDQTISWVSNNTNFATVDSSGVITAVANGQTTITGTVDGKSVTVTVKVITKATAISIDQGESITVNKGAINTLTKTITPATASETVTWSSDDEDVVSINPATGQYTALSAGTALITVSAGEVSDTITINVQVPATGIAINQSDNITLNKDSSMNLSTTVTPEDCTETVEWESSEPTKVTVDSNGRITAVAIGTSTITAKIGTTLSDSIEVEVILAATGVEIQEGSTIDVEKGSSITLHAIIEPSGSTDGVEWSSLTPTVASITSEGVLTANETGQATIKAKVGTVQDTILVNVVIKATGVTINGTKPLSINKGDTTTLSATKTPSNSTDQIVWSTSDSTKVTVDSATGEITGVAKGSATITATAGTRTDTVVVNVLQPATSITISGAETREVNKNSTLQLSATLAPTGCDDTIAWSSSDTTKATVSSSGLVTGKAAGTVTITARSVNQVSNEVSVSDTVTVTVKVPAESLTISGEETRTVNKNATLQLSATISPSDSTDTPVVWSSSDTTKATVSSSGLVTGKAAGTVTITATAGTNTDVTDTVTVTVKVPAESVTISGAETRTVNKNATLQLSATISPSDSTDTPVVWSSSDTTKATVSSTGLVTGKAAGTVTITAKAGTNNDVTDTVTVTVKVPAETITIAGSSSITVPRGTTHQLSATILPSDSTDTPVVWTSSDTSKVTVSSTGLVTGVAKGSATITAKAGTNNDVTDTVTVTVNAPITGFTTTEQDVAIIKGRTKALSYTITPSDTTDSKTVTWTSSNPNKATVDEEGVVTAIEAGTVTITATISGFSIEYTVTVGTIPITSITLNKHSLELLKGENETLTYIVAPEDTTEITDPVWSSNKTNIATVDENGKITGVSQGTATITVSMGGKSDSVEVTVLEIPLTGIIISNTEQSLPIGESLTIHITNDPVNATDDVTFTYESSDESIATVDENGNVTAVSTGAVTITVRTSTGLEDTMELNIVKPQDIINPNTGVKSVIIYIITGICSLLGIGYITKKRLS